MPDEATPPTPEAQPSRSGYSRKEAWRDAVLGLIMAMIIAGTYLVGHHRRVSHLNAFAQCLSGKQIKMYGAFWCPHCAEQKELFGDSFQYINYQECGVRGAARELTAECKQAGIHYFPTWQFPNGERHEGGLPLKTLSDKTGCALP